MTAPVKLELDELNPPMARAPWFGDDKRLLMVIIGISVIVALGRLYGMVMSHVIWEEGHFVVSGQYPDLGYPDIPAGYAWLSTLITSVFGWNLWAHRLVSFIIACLIPLSVYWMVTPVMSRRHALWTAAACLCVAQIVANGTVYYPEGGLQILLALMLGSMIRALKCDESGERPHLSKIPKQLRPLLEWFFQIFGAGAHFWVATGLLAALGLLVHFRFLAPGLGIVVWLLATKWGRAQWKRPVLYLTAFLAFLGLVPTLIYNHLHDWPSYQFHVQNRPHFEPKIDRLFGGIILQMALATPVYFIFMASKIVREMRTGTHQAVSLLAYSAMVIFGFYVFQGSLNKKIMPHWPFLAFIPAMAFIVPAFIDYADRAQSTLSRNFRIGVILSAPLWAVMILSCALGYHWLYVNSATIPPLWRQANVLKNEDWRPLYPKIDQAAIEAQTRFGSNPLFVTDLHWTATRLEFPGPRDRRYFILNDPYDTKVARFDVARRDWGRDYTALMAQKAAPIVLVLNEPFYIYHQPELFEVYDRICRDFSDVALSSDTTLMPGRTRVKIYTAQLNALPLQKADWFSCPFYPKLYIAQPIRGDVIFKDTQDNFYGIAADPKGITKVEIMWDGKALMEATYGLSPQGFKAPDGLNFDPNYPNIQFEFRFPKGTLEIGEHRLSLRATRKDGTQITGADRIIYVAPKP